MPGLGSELATLAEGRGARARGLSKLLGPKGLTALDGMGLLVKGFEHRPALGIPYNLPYYAALIEAAGFESCNNVVSGYLNPEVATAAIDPLHR
jgi:hypothetical protein